MSQTAPNLNEPSQDGSDVLDLLGILRRRFGYVFLGAILGIAAAAMYYSLTKPTYRAQMEILVGEKSGSLVKGASADSSTEGVSADEDVLSTHIQLMTSRRILESAIKKHRLDKMASISEAIAAGDSAVEFVHDNLRVTKGGEGIARDAHTLRAMYDDESPEDCAIVLRAIFDEYNKYLQDQFQGTSSQAINLLTRLANETNDDVKNAENALSDHLSNSKVMWDGERATNIHKDRLEKIETDLSELIEKKAETEARLAVISDFLDKSDPDVVTDFDRLALLSESEMSRLKILFDVTRGDAISEAFQAQQPIRSATAHVELNDYLELVMKEKKLLEDFSDDHPSVISVREQIALMRQFIDKKESDLSEAGTSEKMSVEEMLTTYVGLLKNDIRGYERQRETLTERSEQELKAAKILEREEMTANSLRLELKRQQDTYETMQTTLGELNFVRDYAGFSTDVIGDAETQEDPSWPKPLIVLALGLLAGSALGFCMALLADLMDTTFADPEDVQKALGAPVLAHVPRFAPLRRKKSDGPLLVDQTLRVFHTPKSPDAEVYRVIRTGLLFNARKGGHKVIQVTSPLPGDGKSTTSSNLAVAFAQTGKRTLIVDADMRKPRVATLLHLEGELGLTEVLSGQCNAEDVIQTTAVPNLFAVSAGCIAPNPSELLQSDTFEQMLQIWRNDFDYIIVDTPPVLAVSDAAVVSELADNVLLAVRIIKNGRKAATRAVQVLTQAGNGVGAVIVNGYQTKKRNYGYTGDYSADAYGYGYGESHQAYYGRDKRKLQSV